MRITAVLDLELWQLERSLWLNKKQALNINQGLEPMEREQGLWSCKERNELNKFSKGESVDVGDRLDMEIKNAESKVTS